MPLPLPDLDTRRWTDLVDEARAMIPRFAPAWTDHNVHDPGITLIDLLAWLAEMDIYRLNRVPDSHRRKFLSLVGVRPRGPRAVEAVLGLAPPAPIDVPEGVELTGTPAASSSNGEGSQRYLFRAVEAVHAAPLTLLAVLTQADPSAPLQDVTQHWRGQGTVPALGDDPQVGAALWLRFDQPLPVGQTVRLGLFFGGGKGGPEERQRILDEAARQEEACSRPLPPLPACAETAPGSTPGGHPAGPLQHHSARVVWEFYTTSNEWRALDPDAGEIQDDTRALTLDGAVDVTLPDTMGPVTPGGSDPSHKGWGYYLRVRLAAGEYDTPPLLQAVIVNALWIEQAVPVSQAFVIAAGVVAGGAAPTAPGPAQMTMQLDSAGIITALTFVADAETPQIGVLSYTPATATAPGLIILEAVLLGRSDGTPGQVFPLPQASVQGETGHPEGHPEGGPEGAPSRATSLLTLEPPGWGVWELRPDFDASSGRDRHAVVSETNALVTFGDGNHGHIPPAGTAVLACYRATAAEAGNAVLRQVGAGAQMTLTPSLRNWVLFDQSDFGSKLAALGLEKILSGDPESIWSGLSKDAYTAATARLGAISSPRAISPGAAAESVTAAAGRAYQALQTPTRAITTGDYEALTFATPGTAIARCDVLPGKHPSFPCLSAPGMVTVIVLPGQHRPRPMPSAGLLDAVSRYLNGRRVLGTFVRVVGPEYLTVQVMARVAAMPGASPSRVMGDVIAALNAFLHPLTGGPAAIPPPAHQLSSSLPAPATPSPAPGVTLLAAPAPPVAAPASPTWPPGWPFGRDVYRAEVLQVIDGVAGVDHVLSLELSGDGGPAQCGNLCVGPTQLVVSGTHTIEVV